MDERVAAIGHIQGVTRRGAASIDVPFVHVWTVRDDRLDQLLFFTDTAMLTQALAQQVGWNARMEAKGDVNMATDAADRVRSSRSSSHLPSTWLRAGFPPRVAGKDEGGGLNPSASLRTGSVQRLNGLNVLNFRKKEEESHEE